MAGADGKIPDKQPYKLSGKDYITTRGLNLYDFGARMHDPAAMRFSTPDPLMEQYPSLSPYTYCAANPLKYIDVNGLAIYDIDSNGNVIRVTPNSNHDIINMVGTGRQLTLNSICIEKFGTSSYYSDGSYGFFDYYRIRGDENSHRIFEFMFRNTNVEWSLALVGKDTNGLGFLTTSHLDSSDGGMTALYNGQLKYYYYIREFLHTHSDGLSSYFPSGFFMETSEGIIFLDPPQGDIGFAKDIERIYAKLYKILFRIIVDDEKMTKIEFSGSTKIEDFKEQIERYLNKAKNPNTN